MFTRSTISVLMAGIVFLGLIALASLFGLYGQAKGEVYVSGEHYVASVSESAMIDYFENKRTPASSTAVSVSTSTSTTSDPTAETPKKTPTKNKAKTNAAPPDKVSRSNTRHAIEQTVAVETETKPKLEPDPDIPLTNENGSISSAYETAVALEVHRLTNQKRIAVDLPPLIYDTDLGAVAKAHSADMITDDYFDHVTPDGCDIPCRLVRAEYDATAWAENIAWRTDSNLPSAQDLAAHFFKNWMESKEHRVNLLSDVITREGVGVVRTGNTVYITVDFALK